MAEEKQQTAADNVVKSAGRILLVLELFRELQRPASAREIADRLSIPRSSTNALLASLVNLGYIWFDGAESAYYPTLKVAQLGSWLLDSYQEDSRIYAVLAELSAKTSETIVLAIQAGTQMQYLKVVQSTHPVALNLNAGFKVPLFGSAVGLALLSLFDREQIATTISTFNSRHRDKSLWLSLDDVVATLKPVKKRGVAIAYDAVLPDTGAIAVGVRAALHDQPIVISVGGPSTRIRQNETAIIDALRQTLTKNKLLSLSSFAA